MRRVRDFTICLFLAGTFFILGYYDEWSWRMYCLFLAITLGSTAAIYLFDWFTIYWWTRRENRWTAGAKVVSNMTNEQMKFYREISAPIVRIKPGVDGARTVVTIGATDIPIEFVEEFCTVVEVEQSQIYLHAVRRAGEIEGKSSTYAKTEWASLITNWFIRNKWGGVSAGRRPAFVYSRYYGQACRSVGVYDE